MEAFVLGGDVGIRPIKKRLIDWGIVLGATLELCFGWLAKSKDKGGNGVDLKRFTRHLFFK
jgi:hypothetical protein